MDRTNEGRRVALVRCSDPYTKLEPRSEGTYRWRNPVTGGPDQHSIEWDNGSSLMLLDGVDSFRFIDREDDALVSA
jgi:hypothetical protein